MNNLEIDLNMFCSFMEGCICSNVSSDLIIKIKYNNQIRPREFQPEDLVLRQTDIRGKDVKDGKLASN